MLRYFFDRLAERLAVVGGRLLSLSMESLHADLQAQQQGRLEDLARQYEADGKTEVAAMLRRRMNELGSDDPAARALDIINNVKRHEQQLLAGDESPDGELARLPDLDKPARRPRRKRSVDGTK